MRELLVATTNRGKVNEYRQLLKGLDLKLVSLDEAGISQEADEIYNTFEENARLKATFYAGLSGLLTLADDSGLEVDALGGEPGVKSSRYAGDNATDEQRVAYLLGKMPDIPQEKRQARFRCVIAIAAPDGRIYTADGECPGYIGFEPKGTNGFGYDPIFYLPEYGKTIAELPEDQKNGISHRGRAAVKARQLLERLIAE